MRKHYCKINGNRLHCELIRISKNTVNALRKNALNIYDAYKNGGIHTKCEAVMNYSDSSKNVCEKNGELKRLSLRDKLLAFSLFHVVLLFVTVFHSHFFCAFVCRETFFLYENSLYKLKIYIKLTKY